MLSSVRSVLEFSTPNRCCGFMKLKTDTNQHSVKTEHIQFLGFASLSVGVSVLDFVKDFELNDI